MQGIAILSVLIARHRHMSHLIVFAAIIRERRLNGLISGADYVHLALCGNQLITKAIQSSGVSLAFKDDSIQISVINALHVIAQAYPNAIHIGITSNPFIAIVNSCSYHLDADAPLSQLSDIKYNTYGALQSLHLRVDKTILKSLHESLVVASPASSAPPLFPMLTKLELYLSHTMSDQRAIRDAPWIWRAIEHHAPHIDTLLAPCIFVADDYFRSAQSKHKKGQASMLSRLREWTVSISTAAKSQKCEWIWRLICNTMTSLEHLNVAYLVGGDFSRILKFNIHAYPPCIKQICFFFAQTVVQWPLPPQLKVIEFAVIAPQDPFNLLHISRLPSGLRKLGGLHPEHVFKGVDWEEDDLPPDAPQRLELTLMYGDIQYLPSDLTAPFGLGKLYIITSFVLFSLNRLEWHENATRHTDILMSGIQNGGEDRLLCQLQACIDSMPPRSQCSPTIQKIYWCFVSVLVGRLGALAGMPATNASIVVQRYAGRWKPHLLSKREAISVGQLAVHKKYASFIRQVGPFFWPDISIDGSNDKHLDALVEMTTSRRRLPENSMHGEVGVIISRGTGWREWRAAIGRMDELVALKTALNGSMQASGERDMSVEIHVSSDHQWSTEVLKALPQSLIGISLHFRRLNDIRCIRLMAQHLPAGLKTLHLKCANDVMVESLRTKPNHWFDLCRLFCRDTLHVVNLSQIVFNIPMHGDSYFIAQTLSKLNRFMKDCNWLAPLLKPLNMDDKPRRSPILTIADKSYGSETARPFKGIRSEMGFVTSIMVVVLSCAQIAHQSFGEMTTGVLLLLLSWLSVIVMFKTQCQPTSAAIISHIRNAPESRLQWIRPIVFFCALAMLVACILCQ